MAQNVQPSTTSNGHQPITLPLPLSTITATNEANGASSTTSAALRTNKRPRDSTPAQIQSTSFKDQPQITSFRRIEFVVFSGYEIKPGFASPYPIDELMAVAPAGPSTAQPLADKRVLAQTAGSAGGKAPKTGSRKSSTKAHTPVAPTLVTQVGEVLHPEEALEDRKTLLSPELELGLLEAREPSPELGLSLNDILMEDILAPESSIDPEDRTSTPVPSVGEPIALEGISAPNPPPVDVSLMSNPGFPPFSFQTIQLSNDTVSSLPPIQHVQPKVPAAPLQPLAPLSSSSSDSDHPMPFAFNPAALHVAAPPPLPPALPPVVPASGENEDLGVPAPATEPNSVPPSHIPSSIPQSPNSRPQPPSRGNGGRFLPKPEGESVKSKRKIAKAAKEAELIANPPPARPMTVREQRERDRKEREEKEKLAGPSQSASETTKRLFVCRGCFKYMVHEGAYKAHEKTCDFKHPPGRKVYQRGAHTIWEVDGAIQKLYCQNLCLFSKLFIEHKYMFFDLEGFMFYILTDATPSQDWVLGYFSKEKVSYDDYNLACIVTFPPYQKKNYGTLLIEFSYELSRRLSPTPGTPERPLSDLGLKGYLSYWTGVLVRYFRAVYQVRGDPEPLAFGAQPSEEEAQRRRNRRSRGWDGELPPGVTSVSTTLTFRRNSGGTPTAAMTKKERRLSSTTGSEFEFPTSLEEVADATNMRKEDVAFALVESGLAVWRRKRKVKVEVEDVNAVDLGLATPIPNSGGAGGGGMEELEEEKEMDELVITPELVEEVAERKQVKRFLVMELAHVLL
ncbi:acyl-CoA N-acyltransferase [Meredithblackwellia eburnea MCA 4105]